MSHPDIEPTPPRGAPELRGHLDRLGRHLGTPGEDGPRPWQVGLAEHLALLVVACVSFALISQVSHGERDAVAWSLAIGVPACLGAACILARKSRERLHAVALLGLEFGLTFGVLLFAWVVWSIVSGGAGR
jgi:hypothetical protein